MTAFPRTEIAGVSISRMIIGSNWMLGYSHTSTAADEYINLRNRNREAIAELLGTFLEAGVDTFMGPLAANPVALDGAKLAEDKTGKKLILIDTPMINVDDTPEGRRETEKIFDAVKAGGATFCMPHHYSVEQLVCKRTQTIDRLPDYLSMIRDRGMIPGLSAHMPELILYSDRNAYDVQTYIQIFNCMGFLMQMEVELVHKVIWESKKPVMTIKPMAAGRVSPFVGLTFSWSTIRPCDMVTVGCLTPREAQEDIEISLAAIERRRPELEKRNSPHAIDA